MRIDRTRGKEIRTPVSKAKTGLEDRVFQWIGA